MALNAGNHEKLETLVEKTPKVSIFLQPIAPPAALGLAGFSGSTFVSAMWIAHWWGNGDSPAIFFPFVAFWGGLAQFIAGIEGFKARDVLVTVINTMWGAFWMSAGVMWLLNATGTLPAHSVDEHFPELASWFTVVAAFTWVGAFAATARDVILATLLACLATGSTIALCLFAGPAADIRAGMKAAAYFWIVSAVLAWWRVTVYLVEEAYGPRSRVAAFFPVFRMPKERSAPLVVPGLGEPGVKRGMPGVV